MNRRVRSHRDAAQALAEAMVEQAVVQQAVDLREQMDRWEAHEGREIVISKTRTSVVAKLMDGGALVVRGTGVKTSEALAQAFQQLVCEQPIPLNRKLEGAS